ncbi:hypothetical protein NP493_712g01009 [Ridgeia piscesae]|uniref:Uncharacterized protein n=1 Tax=Ridgeia piscesae TaxID=27915 RepID=A0AAD9KR28_RIDPI|nr:hypothetical protein NP493_712g01009 [Ridgeia piscesae]
MSSPKPEPTARPAETTPSVASHGLLRTQLSLRHDMMEKMSRMPKLATNSGLTRLAFSFMLNSTVWVVKRYTSMCVNVCSDSTCRRDRSRTDCQFGYTET